jgi:hypothetical protein
MKEKRRDKSLMRRILSNLCRYFSLKEGKHKSFLFFFCFGDWVALWSPDWP